MNETAKVDMAGEAQGASMRQGRSARGFTWLGHTDLAGQPDGVQVMVNRRVAYVCHPFTGGISVVDVSDPRNLRPLTVLPTHPRSWSLHCQTFGDLLLVAEEFNFIAAKPSGSSWREVDCSAGMRVYDISNPREPRAIAFMPVEGLGLHRIWWNGDRYAYASAMLEGYVDHVLVCIDLLDPERPSLVGTFWLPGTWRAGGETQDAEGRIAIHHPVVVEGVAYCGWRDAGLVIVDVTDPAHPTLLGQRNLRPPFGGNTHTALPLPKRGLCIVADEAAGDIAEEPQRYIWVMDVRQKSNPVPIATMPIPAELEFTKEGGGFGPHNIWENRRDAYVSDTLVFATFQSGGVRVYDIANPYQPAEVAHFVPPPPRRLVDPRPGTKLVTHSADVYVASDGLVYVTDYNSGFYALQYE